MKRLLSMVLILAAVIAIIAFPASAAVYTRTFENDLMDDYAYNVGNSTGYVAFIYTASFLGMPGSIATSEYVPSGGTGWVFSYITRQYYTEVEAYSNQDTSISNNKLECAVSLSNYLDPTKTNHFASRTYNGASDGWDYYYQTSYHGEGVN